MVIGLLAAQGCVVRPEEPRTAAAPGTAAHAASVNVSTGCVDSHDPDMDYFPDKAVLEYAEGFSVEYFKNYKVVTVKESYEGGSPERYLLFQCGTPRPNVAGEPAPAAVVSVPVESLFSESTTHLPPIVDLGRLEVLTGVGSATYLTTEPVLRRIAEGKVLEYAPRAAINAELVISSSPSVLMATGVASADFAVIRNAGIPVVANAEWLESTPLGRAEWIKYVSLFLNEEARAQRHFETIVRNYTTLASKMRTIPGKDRPRVMTGMAERGLFTVAGGKSYVAELIADAGGVYVWADSRRRGALTVDLETAIERASQADIWINGGVWPTLDLMQSEEPRYARFKAFRLGQVWLYDRHVSSGGGNDYWARGVTRPDLILADLVKIFHPGMAPDHEFQWYRQVKEK
jgi:iron complex transport system substrate-binding protein